MSFNACINFIHQQESISCFVKFNISNKTEPKAANIYHMSNVRHFSEC